MADQMIRLLAVDDFLFSDWNIPPGIITKESSHLGFGIERRSGVYSSVFFGATAQPAMWRVLLQCPSEEARQRLISVLAGQRSRPFRLLAQRLQYGQELITIEAAVSGNLEESGRGTIYVNFESNDSIWFAEDSETTSKTFTSPLDQTVHLAVPGNVPTSPVIRITPTAQRAATTPYVGWGKRQRWVISNESDSPLFRYEVMIDLGNTAALVSGGKARADGADLRVWLHGLEQSRSLVGWNTSSTALWVIVPILPPRQSLTYDVVYGNPLATSADGVDLTYPDAPAHDFTVGTNFVHRYRSATAIAHAGEGLWPLSSPLEGGSADYGVPGAWQPALTYENPNNTDNYVQPRSRRVNSGQTEWYQSVLYATRWRGDSWDGEFLQYAGSDPFDGVTLYNPLGIRSVQADGLIYVNNAKKKTVVTTEIIDPADKTVVKTESTEVLAKYEPPFTRAVVIGRNSGGEGWHVLAEYDESTIDPNAPDTGLLYLPSSGSAAIFPAFASGWESTEGADRLAAKSIRGTTSFAVKSLAFSSFATDFSGTSDLLLRQYVYPLPAGVQFKTTDTVKGRVGAREDGAYFDARAQLTIRVMTAESVVRATLLGFDTGSLSEEFEAGAGFNGRDFPRTSPSNLQANYTTVAGDYLVMEYGFRRHGTENPAEGDIDEVGLVFGDKHPQYALPLLPEGDDTPTGQQGAPWIKFSTDLSGAPAATATTDTAPTDNAWTPPTPLKHFGFACWPSGVTSIPDDAEGRVSLSIESDITVHIAAESLIITKIEDETDIYELATEFRLPGSGNAVGPYHALLVGNARQQSGPGTPRAAIKLNTQALQIDTERRTHTVWDADFSMQEESVSAHAVRALTGDLRQVDATDIPSLKRTSVALTNPSFGTNLTGWSEHSGGSGWTVSVARDPLVGGAALGSMKFAITSASAGTLLHRTDAYYDVDPDENVEVTAWMRQGEAGASSPRLGIAWYNGSSVLVATTLDHYYGIPLNPSQDRTMVLSAPVPAGATKFRVLLGVTVDANAPATKWFDDVTATIYTPQRYDATIAKITEEMRASRWVPLIPPRRTVINGAFDADINGWELHDDGTGITQAASHDAAIGGYQNGSLKVAITANSGSDQVTYLNAQPLNLSGFESATVGGWVRTSNAGLVPRLCIAWYVDPEGNPVDIDIEATWQPAINTGYSRAFGAIAPPEAEWFRVGFVVDTSASATGSVWIDDLTINDNDLLVADTSPGELDVAVTVRPRWVP